MRHLSLIISFFMLSITLYGQSFNDDKTAFSNFLKRMYTSSSFEGVKIVEDYEDQYLISVISLEASKYPNDAIMNRVAQVKAQSQASTFINGATISMDMIISTREVKNDNEEITTLVETMEQIRQNSAGFSQGLELLTNFKNENSGRLVFVYGRAIN